MKFRFRRSGRIVRKRRALRLRGVNTLRQRKETALIRNYSAEDFGVFEEADNKKSPLGALWSKLSSLITKTKDKFASKKGKRPQLPTASLVGALCAALSLTAVSGLAVILSLFLRYGAPYTEVVVPDLVSLGKDQALEVSDDLFEYTVIYESNPEKEPNIVISQSPLSGVTRKLYNGKERIKITLTVNSAPSVITLPKLIGTQARDAVLSLKNAGVSVQLIEEYSDSVASGRIFFSSLPEGSLLTKGDKITLKSSLGKRTQYHSVPNLSGLNEYEAIALLKSKGLTVGDIKYENSKMPIGTVISQDRAANTELPEGARVSLIISGGIYY